ncbi:class II aldolase/adducin family protein [Conexibacter sp. JD483]|uniref:class II aldolase/adducin family protein n=1 Tax=unclassified Conexibacter TaxID=2627773 RepID=UPI0027175877|nr:MULTISPECIES: class II aldolase/adducin family protein [unclassified Conexibacter]MDO8186250.1 class II aldolase/adducin family protein [Conexibacter sp. CPCC 205706]MDO8199683.1 class II aldolase/adducin family protein [Conexibacter sp. CPCC 205762]MDR9368225.1 class II aldolase/adducin family protein [Conexibacter sp. JD483]
MAAAARLIARAGLVEAFGHVSARAGDGFLLTSTAPLASQTAASIHRLGPDGGAGEGIPLEAPLHAALYAARPDVGAICRTHSRAAVAWAARGAVPPLLHGLGGLAGTVAAWDGDPDLVTSEAHGARAAAALGAADCLLLRANGAVATGATLRQAAVRAWFLEERARVALDAGPQALPLIDLDRRSRHFAAEEERAWRWLREAFAGASGTGRADATEAPR